MKRIIGVSLFLLVFFHFLPAQEQENTKKVLLLTPLNLSDKKAYPNTEIYETIFFRSIYNVIRVIPAMDIPDESQLLSISWNRNNLAEITENNNSEFIIYIAYKMSGKNNDLRIMLNVRIFSRSVGKDVMNRQYVSSTDYDLLDTVDQVIDDTATTILKTRISFAYIRFENFSLGGRTFSLYLDDKKIANLTNDDYRDNMKIMANQNYRVNIRDSENNVVFERNVKLEERESIEINFHADAEVPVARTKELASITRIYHERRHLFFTINRGADEGVNTNDVFEIYVPNFRYKILAKKWVPAGERDLGVVVINKVDKTTAQGEYFNKKSRRLPEIPELRQISKDGKARFLKKQGFTLDSFELRPFNVFMAPHGNEVLAGYQLQVSGNIPGWKNFRYFSYFKYGYNESPRVNMFDLSVGLEYQWLMKYNKASPVFFNIGFGVGFQAGLAPISSTGANYAFVIPMIYEAVIGRWAWIGINPCINVVNFSDSQIGLYAGVVAFRF